MEGKQIDGTIATSEQKRSGVPFLGYRMRGLQKLLVLLCCCAVLDSCQVAPALMILGAQRRNLVESPKASEL